MELALERGATPIELDRPRILFFDHRAAFWIYSRYGAQFLMALFRLEGEGEAKKPVLKDPDVLCFFLWAGLLADARAHGEELTIEQVERMITPFNISTAFTRVTIALNATVSAKESPGKEQAAESPAAVAPKAPAPAATTSTKRKGSRSER